MTFGSSLLYASRLLFPRTGKKSNARRSLIGACVCIGISLVPLIMVLTLSDGMIQGITERYIGLSSGHIDCEIYHYSDESGSAENLISLAQAVESLDSVKKAFPQIEGVGLAAGKNGRTGATIRAVEKSMFTRNDAFSSLFEVVDGSAEFKDEKSAVVGEKFAETLGLKAGSTFRLITTKKLPDGKIIPKNTAFKVSGIISCGYQELDALWVFIPIEKGFDILPVSSSKISVKVETYDAFSSEINRTAADIEENFPIFYYIARWNEVRENKMVFDNFESTQVMLIMIMMLIILVASVNIASALVMLVMERRKEIAILKSLGATNKGITTSFLVTGMATGGIGVCLGIPVGLLCAVNVDKIIFWIEKIVNFISLAFYSLFDGDVSDFTEVKLLSPEFYLQKLSLEIPVEKVALICAGTIVLSLIVSAIPAIKAGREKPLEIMRKN